MAVKRRADFAENRVRILEAADEIFVERGVGAPLDSIAQRAGVGRATFFRHFPDRRALINEMLDLFLSKLEETSSKLDVTETSINEITPMFYDQMIHYAPVADFLRAADGNDFAAMEAVMDRAGPTFIAKVSNCYLRRAYQTPDGPLAAWMCPEGPARSRVVMGRIGLTAGNTVSVAVVREEVNDRPAPERAGSAFAD